MTVKPLTIELPPLHPAQRAVRDDGARFKVLACGRRWGKSRLASALATECALQKGAVWIITPSYSTGDPMFNDVRRLAAQIPGATINRSDRRIDYPGAGIVQVRSGDQPELLRGNSLDLAIFDEAAHAVKLQELWVEIIRPALADRRGRALFLSSPNGRNYFWQLFQLGQDASQTDWQSWQLPTSTNPHIAKEEIENARRSMTERAFLQEFEAQFVDSSGVFRNVRELATAHPQPGPAANHLYYAGIDWGRSGDYTAICLYDATSKALACLDRFTGLPFDVQLGRVRTVIELWKPVQSTIELNSIGTPLFEQLQKMQLPTRLHGFTTGNANKGQLVDALALALERKAITLLDDPVLVGELQAFAAETLPSGLIRYGAPSGQHDDCVIALLLAYGPTADSSGLAAQPAVMSSQIFSRAELVYQFF